MPGSSPGMTSFDCRAGLSRLTSACQHRVPRRCVRDRRRAAGSRALDLQQLTDGAVAGAPAAVHGFDQFLIGHVGKAHRHSNLAPETDREPDILVQQAQREIGRVVFAGQKFVAEPVEGAHRPVAPWRTASHRSTGSTPALMPIVKTSASAMFMTAPVQLCTSLAIEPAPIGPI